MRPQAGKLALALLATLAGAALCAVPADAQLAFVPCAHTTNFACAHLAVPLDPSGATPGTVTLAIRRHLAPVGGARSAVVALAGGPGQSAIPFAEPFTEVLGPILATRDLIVYDQRGTGLSHPLSCHGFEQPGAYHSIGGLIAACAGQIGAERAFYTTPDSVADIEAIRRAAGYEKLVLYGTSYGTKVALEYAQEYPEHVEALILDSTVTPGGPDPLGRPTFAAIPRILRQLCAFRGCAHITRNPVADLARLVRRMSAGPIAGRAIDGRGHAHRVYISSSDLVGILVQGDFDQLLRAEFIGAVHSALHGDDAALGRLIEHAAQGGGREGQEGIDVPLYFATSCEEQAFPWSRTASPSARRAQALAALRALPASTFAPFTSSNALAFSDISACSHWPFATPAPPVLDQPLPDVPTLIFSGADDLRTPTSGARTVAAQIPDAHVVVVPNTGHAVLPSTSDPCARRALLAQFAAKPVASCAPAPPPAYLKPTPLAPTRLSEVASAHGYSGRPGRTLQAVKLTVADFGRQLLPALLETLQSTNPLGVSLRIGGLRSGWAQLTTGAIRFHDYTYVPGVRISGTLEPTSADLHIGGSAAAHGTLRLGPHHALVGVIGGRHVRIAAAEARAGAARNSGTTYAPVATRLPSALATLQVRLEALPAGFGEIFSSLPQLWALRRSAAL